jgi:hypothetical protein
MHNLKRILMVWVMAFLTLSCANQNVKYSAFAPGEIWLDNQDVAINAHGGGFLVHNGIYYWFGEHKGEGKTGNKALVGVGVYSSTDLYNWKNEGIALKVLDDENSMLQKGSVVERPKVIYNKRTQKFVMWFHHELKGQGYKAALTGVAVANQVTGPYEYINSFRIHPGVLPKNLSPDEFESIPNINENQDLTRQIRIDQAKSGELFKRDFAEGQMSRDMTLFVDEDETAYHVTASEENQTLLVSKLSDDYLTLTEEFVRVLPGERNEAPAIFKKDGRYFMFSSGLTGWKPNPARLAVADELLGEWTPLGNPVEGNEEQKQTTFHSQSTYVIPVQGKADAFIFVADRWTPKNAIDGRYVWLPVLFDENGMPYLKWFETWDLSIFDEIENKGFTEK